MIKILTGFHDVKFKVIKRTTFYKNPAAGKQNFDRTIVENLKILLNGFLLKFGVNRFEDADKIDIQRFETQIYNKYICSRCYSDENNTMLRPCNHSGICEKCAKDLCLSHPVCPFCGKEFDHFVAFNYSVLKRQEFSVKELKSNNQQPQIPSKDALDKELEDEFGVGSGQRPNEDLNFSDDFGQEARVGEVRDNHQRPGSRRIGRI